MKKWLSKVLLRLAGWKASSLEGVHLPKCVICVAPHTSNWDFVVGKLFYTSQGLTAGFLMKKDWFFFPFNYIFRSMGGIPIDRSRQRSVTDQVAEMFRERKHFQVAITPEGTRKKTNDWKKGFYYIALGADIPIVLVGIDYQRKCIAAEKYICPSGNIEEDMREIKLYFKDFKGKHPERFDIGKY